MSKKRSIVSSERFKDLKQENSVYVISFCTLDQCYCNNSGEMCSRGFFSLFIQALYGIAFAKRLNIPYYIDFGVRKSLYSDPEKGEQNFWNYFFHQPFPHFPIEAKPVANLNYEVFPLRIWSRSHFRQLHQEVVGNLHFQKDVLEVLQEKKEFFKGKKILGVQLRGTDHSTEVMPVRLERIIEEIDKRVQKYDELFVATDDSRILSLIQERFGSKLILNKVSRSSNEFPVHENMGIKDRYRLGLEVLVDCYCLSLCKYAILQHSNISYAALLFNPHLPYTLLERVKERNKRIKTLVLYFLDRAGVRKW